MKSEFGDPLIDEVKKHLLHERDRKVKKVIGIGHREISKQLITDLYCLPGSGGSDEREKAREWFLREIGLFGLKGDSFENWGKMQDVLLEFREPYLHEINELAAKLGLGQSR
ncbi:MAG: hypothetical protein AB7G93_13420 [Bdellovibrionales bacterium]